MKILIIQLRQLGDVLLSTPLSKALKDNIKNVSVHFLTSEASYGILKNNPYIDKIYLLNNGFTNELNTLIKIRKEKYDAVLDLQRTGRSKRLTLLSGAKIKAAFFSNDNFYYNKLIKSTTSGYTTFERMDILNAVGLNIDNKTDYLPKMYHNEEDINKAKEYLKSINTEKFFIVNPCARKKEKMWDAVQFGKLSNEIYLETGIKPIVVYGSDREKELAILCYNEIQNAVLINKPFSITEFAALMSLSEFSLGNDSFSSHIAVSCGIKTIVICGPTSGWFPKIDSVLPIYKNLPCQPCNDYKSCKFNMACYKTLSYKDISDKIIRFIDN